VESEDIVRHGFIPPHGGYENQACFLLKQQIREQEREFLEQGGIRERMTKARIEASAAR
jgi:four helix bundle suffix protein